MRYTPYPFQAAGVEHAATFLSSAAPGAKQLYAAPTGCGKSVVELLLKERFQDLWIVTPRDEIVSGMLDKLGDPDGDMFQHRISTPIKLRNRLLDGTIRHPPQLIFDEGHHHNAETWQMLDLLTGLCPSVAYTATPYRGSPKSTKEFRDAWGEPLWLITYEEAVRERYISMPTFSMLPLVDDDVVEVKGGEFEVTSIDSATVDRLGDVAEHSRQWYSDKWDRPTVYALPSTASCVRLHKELSTRGLPCAVVNAATSRRDRQTIFEAATNRLLALLHINVVQEGVDLPLRRLVDLAPTMSPVKWVQQLGRITRPTDAPPEYICTNRNLLRHSYVLEGVVPNGSVVAAERAFPSSTRPHVRALGLEALGRFKPTSAKLASGLTLSIYSLTASVDSTYVEYCCLVHPNMEPVWACKVNRVVEDKKVYGSWIKCDAPNDVKGFSSVSPSAVTKKQMSWWKRSALRYGLDVDQDVTRKSFQALPVLSDLGLRLR